ncbi:MAG: ABC transporter ATP-binding protein, partial [Actinomycetota bacterium]
MGESGSGKTVFARSIAGLLPPRGVKREGEILFQGRDLLKLDEHELRRVLGAEIAMIFQDPMTALNPVMRVGAQVVEELRLREKLNRREARDAAIALLRSVHIPAPESVVRRYPHELSGGMRQRIVIAIAISCGPQILLADEPTTALDVTVQAQILDLLAEKQRETNAATILVTHDLGVVANRTDRTAVMYAGKIVEIGPTASLFQDTRMPYTEALLKSIPRMDTPTRSRLQAIGGRPPDLAKPREGCRFAERCPYVRDRCRVEEPTLQPTATPEHQFACWYPVGLNRIE